MHHIRDARYRRFGGPTTYDSFEVLSGHFVQKQGTLTNGHIGDGLRRNTGGLRVPVVPRRSQFLHDRHTVTMTYETPLQARGWPECVTGVAFPGPLPILPVTVEIERFLVRIPAHQLNEAIALPSRRADQDAWL